MLTIWTSLKICRLVSSFEVNLTYLQQLLLPFPKQALVFKGTSLLKNTVEWEKEKGKGEIALNEQSLLFPPCLPPVWKTFCHFHQI